MQQRVIRSRLCASYPSRYLEIISEEGNRPFPCGAHILVGWERQKATDIRRCKSHGVLEATHAGGKTAEQEEGWGGQRGCHFKQGDQVKPRERLKRGHLSRLEGDVGASRGTLCGESLLERRNTKCKGLAAL